MDNSHWLLEKLKKISRFKHVNLFAISFKRDSLLKTIKLKLIVNKNNIFNIKFLI